MMTILLIIYFLFLLAFTVFSIAGVYHLFRFGYIHDLTKIVAYIYSISSLAIIIISIILILTRDWSVAFSIQ